MNKSTFFIVGKHPVIEALKNSKRKVFRVFLTEESKKTIHRENQNKNLLKDIKIFFKTKKELDKYTTKENLMHQGYVAEVEQLDDINIKEFIKEKNNLNIVCLDEVTDPRNIGSIIRSLTSFNIDGLIADLGVSAYHFTNNQRGFSLKYDSIIDMRMDNRLLNTGKIILNTYTSDNLNRIFIINSTVNHSIAIIFIIKYHCIDHFFHSFYSRRISSSFFKITYNRWIYL